MYTYKPQTVQIVSPVLAKDAIACGARFLLFITDVVKEIQTTKYLNMVTKCLVYIQTTNSCTAEQLHEQGPKKRKKVENLHWHCNSTVQYIIIEDYHNDKKY